MKLEERIDMLTLLVFLNVFMTFMIFSDFYQYPKLKILNYAIGITTILFAFLTFWKELKKRKRKVNK